MVAPQLFHLKEQLALVTFMQVKDLSKLAVLLQLVQQEQETVDKTQALSLFQQRLTLYIL